nr:cytochrome c peroxidase [Limnobacter parvus]
MPTLPASPDNPLTKNSVSLGKTLFFDPRLSRNGNMSCASCHNPSLGWSDGLKTARGDHGKLLPRATPTITNVAYSKILMWDVRHPSLESQALGPMESEDEMNTDFEQVLGFLSSNAKYQTMFKQAFPAEGVSTSAMAKALANFQRTVVVNDSRFDRWLAGDTAALSWSEWRGFQLFKGKAMCSKCHSATNFTDDGFHNIGLSQLATEKADVGRYLIRKVKVNKGAFKTPPLRDVANTAPYFHDGSSGTLSEVIDHYTKGGEIRTNLSPNMFALDLTELEKKDLVEFMYSLSSAPKSFDVPSLP